MENFNQIESDILNKIKNVSDRNVLDSVKTESNKNIRGIESNKMFVIEFQTHY